MPSTALFLTLATLLPLASFVLLVFLGKRMGKPLAGWVATVAIGLSFVCSIMAMSTWINGGSYADPTAGGRMVKWGKDLEPINLTFKWIPVGEFAGQDHPGYLDLGVYVDSLTVVMFAMITLVSMLVHIFSIGYMAEDKRFPRFFTYLSLFCFSMLGLVLGGTILQLFVFWELVGLCSYLLIGFWYEKKSASNAAIKAFVTNRVGDFGFLIGLGILFYHLGNVSLPDIWRLLGGAASGGPVTVFGQVFTPTLLTIMGVGLFFGAVGKSAQFPLHVWLPDAMEGPTPVSALIHAATMVAAGVYLVGRIFPILTPDARLFIAIIGVVTLTMAALIAIAQSDIKKVLAYSTLSQLGYMILAMGVGSWIGGLFHLITHAFFKALLFLGSGSVIHAMHHEQEMSQYGGLWRKIPVTAFTFLIAVLAISGLSIAGLGFSGYYSKDMILAHAGAFASYGQSISKYYWLLFILPAAIAVVTPFYMTRCWMLTFWGKPRNQHAYEHAHESPIMYGPLVVLALFAVVAGFPRLTYVREMIESSMKESAAYVETRNGVFASAWPASEPERAGAAEEAGQPHSSRAASMPVAGAASHASPDEQRFEQAYTTGEHLVRDYVFWAPIIGILIGIAIYWRGYAVANLLMRLAPLRWIHTWLYRRMYFDELYMGIFVAAVMLFSRLGAAFDKYVIDGAVNLVATVVRVLSTAAGLNDKYVVDGAVHGVANATAGIGAAARAPQTGRIRLYMLALIGLAALGLAAVVLVSVY